MRTETSLFFLFQNQLNFYIRYLRECFKILGNHLSSSFAFLMQSLGDHLPPSCVHTFEVFRHRKRKQKVTDWLVVIFLWPSFQTKMQLNIERHPDLNRGTKRSVPVSDFLADWTLQTLCLCYICMSNRNESNRTFQFLCRTEMSRTELLNFCVEPKWGETFQKNSSEDFHRNVSSLSKWAVRTIVANLAVS